MTDWRIRPETEGPGAARSCVKSFSEPSVGFDENALPGALFSRLDGDVFLARRHLGHAGCTLGVALRLSEYRVAFPHVRESIVQKYEDVGSDLFAQTITSTQVLVDPNLHFDSVGDDVLSDSTRSRAEPGGCDSQFSEPVDAVPGPLPGGETPALSEVAETDFVSVSVNCEVAVYCDFNGCSDG